MLPMSVTVPPLRTQSMAVAMVSLRPTASRTTSAPKPSVCSQDFARQVGAGEIERLVHSERAREIQPRGIDVGDEYARGAGGAGGLHGEQPDHARADDQRGLPA